MRITEEKVSASLRDMHISSEYKPHSYCLGNNANDMDVNELFLIEFSPKNIILLYFFFLKIPENSTSVNTMNDIGATKSDSQATLIMCEELRKLNKIDSIIPQPLLNLYVYKGVYFIFYNLCFITDICT